MSLDDAWRVAVAMRFFPRLNVPAVCLLLRADYVPAWRSQRSCTVGVVPMHCPLFNRVIEPCFVPDPLDPAPTA